MHTKFEVGGFTHSWDNTGYVKTLGSPRIRRSTSPKVADFGTNWKRIYDFLLVCNSNIGLISHRFGDIAGFFVLLDDPAPIPPKFWECSRCIKWLALGSPRAEALSYSAMKLFSKKFPPMCSRYLNVAAAAAGSLMFMWQTHTRQYKAKKRTQ